MAKKILMFIGSSVFWLVIFAAAETLLMMFVLMPILWIIPSGLKETAVSTSVMVARVFADTSELTLKPGKTCNQLGGNCVASFILEGAIGAGDGKKFEKKLLALRAANASIDVVCLNSGGGSNEEAAYIAGVIKKENLKTCVGDMPVADDYTKAEGLRYTASCESACAIILLASKERIAIGERFVLGLHSGRANLEFGDDRQQVSPVAVGDESASRHAPANFTSQATLLDSLSAYKNKLAISDEQLKTVLIATSRTPGGRMYFASVEEQMQLGFFTVRK